jgi:hypothetical protein
VDRRTGSPKTVTVRVDGHDAARIPTLRRSAADARDREGPSSSPEGHNRDDQQQRNRTDDPDDDHGRRRRRRRTVCDEVNHCTSRAKVNHVVDVQHLAITNPAAVDP